MPDPAHVADDVGILFRNDQSAVWADRVGWSRELGHDASFLLEGYRNTHTSRNDIYQRRETTYRVGRDGKGEMLVAYKTVL